MVRKQENVLKIDENVKKQTESARKSYLDWVERNRNLWLDALNSFDTQVEVMLAMQLGYIDMLKNMMEIKPDFSGIGKDMHPFTGHFEHINELNKEFIEIKKKKAEKIAKSLQKYHRKSVESTLEAFDKYCDLLSTS